MCCLMTESVVALLTSGFSITDRTTTTTTTTTIGQQQPHHDPFLALLSHHHHHNRRSSGHRRHHYFNSADAQRLKSSSSTTTQLSAGLKGTDKEQDDNNPRKNEISLTNNNNTPVGLPFPLPSISQVLSIWVFGISANRVLQSLSSIINTATTENNNKLVLNIALNAIILIGSSIYLLKSIQGIDYSSLEDLDQNSLAKQAGSWALDGTIPTTFEVTTTDENNNTKKKLYEVCSFGGGCFWGTELYFQRIPGVIATCVGYTQGSVDKPNYEQVCSGTTGHTEGIQLIYDPSICSYERLLNQLFDIIDPTLLNQVGNDRGSQYRHGVYYHTDEQYRVASIVFRSIRAKYGDGKGGNNIVTELKPATIFWPAENYHQRYLEKGGQSAAKKCEEKVRCYG